MLALAPRVLLVTFPANLGGCVYAKVKPGVVSFICLHVCAICVADPPRAFEPVKTNPEKYNTVCRWPLQCLVP